MKDGCTLSPLVFWGVGGGGGGFRDWLEGLGCEVVEVDEGWERWCNEGVELDVKDLRLWS
jgi:hypothetical protein